MTYMLNISGPLYSMTCKELEFTLNSWKFFHFSDFCDLDNNLVLCLFVCLLWRCYNFTEWRVCLSNFFQCRLRYCYMTDEGCSAVTSALKSNPSHLRELNLSGNQLGDSGLKNISDLLMNPQCKLEKLELVTLYCTAVKVWCIIIDLSHCSFLFRLCGCSIKEKHCYLLSSALRLNPSHLRELDLSGNELKNTRVKHLCDALKDSHCKLERLRWGIFTYIEKKKCFDIWVKQWSVFCFISPNAG